MSSGIEEESRQVFKITAIVRNKASNARLITNIRPIKCHCLTFLMILNIIIFGGIYEKAVFLFACGQQAIETHSTMGVIKSIENEIGSIEIATDKFPDGFMEAMTMSYKLQDISLVKN